LAFERPDSIGSVDQVGRVIANTKALTSILPLLKRKKRKEREKGRKEGRKKGKREGGKRKGKKREGKRRKGRGEGREGKVLLLQQKYQIR
jgi:hypothetical protein